MIEPSRSVYARVITWICEGVTHICLTIAGLSLLSIVAINGANVTARYGFGLAFSWAEELMLFLMILGVFSGAIAVTWRNAHIRIEAIVERLPPTLSRAVRMIVAVASMIVLAVVMVASFRLVSLLYSMEQRSDALSAPMWMPQSFVTIGLGMIVLMIFARLAIALQRA